jgi:uncharacterized lipoprotein NlpE involved in copper resistance
MRKSLIVLSLVMFGLVGCNKQEATSANAVDQKDVQATATAPATTPTPATPATPATTPEPETK